MARSRQGEQRFIKCVIWDLDNTLWQGVLLEDTKVFLRDDVRLVIERLDDRGILQSIASKNDPAEATNRLREFGLLEYFLYPQINWNSKASSIKAIAESLNIGLDALAFIDDQRFELDDVAFSFPEVLCISAMDLDHVLDMPEMNPRFVTLDSRLRRQMYQSEIERKVEEETFVGSKEEFLMTLGMIFGIGSAREDDLQRAEELTVRTNQLNSTGYTYSYEELDWFRQSQSHKLLISSLEDKYGSYGKIGLGLLELTEDAWIIKLLLMSCRVMTRGVGTVFLNYIMSAAKKKGVKLLAEFAPNNRNRMMQISYKFAGFRERETKGDLIILENDLERIQPPPDYITVRIEEEPGNSHL
ncbi:MAG: HAD-IIIC family phosphatase [Blastocatellia bacterium]